MNRLPRLFEVLLSFALLFSASAAGQAPAPAPTQFAVIVHPSTPIDDLSLRELRRVFLGQQQFWQGGERIVLFVHDPSTDVGRFALRHIYQMSEREFKRYWIAKTFRDDVTMGPKIVSSSTMAKKLTASVPGAVAVIPATDVDDTVKVVSIDNQLPGVDSYPLSAKPRS